MVIANGHCTGTVGKSAGTVVISSGHCAGTHQKCRNFQRALCDDMRKVWNYKKALGRHTRKCANL
jgi:hypothetical protein